MSRAPEQFLVAGDIGGTKCTIMLFRIGSGRLDPLCRFSARTRESQAVEPLLENFLAFAAQQGFELKNSVAAAGFGIAGTIVEGRVVSNNLPWDVQAEQIAHGFGIGRNCVVLLNDLVATASSLAYLKPEDVLALNDGTPLSGAPKALIAAGTGLGEAILFPDESGYRVSPSEAGLSDFAARTEREFQLVHALRQHMTHVCVEEIVSGRGFRLIHENLFPASRHLWFDDPAVDAAARITQQGLAGECQACADALQVWTEAYGAEAGNMALRILPFGGVYVAGGIALKILPKLKDGSFVRAFSDKQNLSTQLAKIPIFVVLNEDAPVIGAAYSALTACQHLPGKGCNSVGSLLTA